MSESLPEVYLARHGETAWAITGRHTGRTDLPLTDRGRKNAEALAGRLRGLAFTAVLSSPLARARQTAELAGFATAADDPDLAEWDYGDYEGKTTAEVREERPDWHLFRDGCPGGETVEAVGDRADRVVGRLRGFDGRVLLFGHGHYFRVLASRWLGLPPGDGRLLVLSTASLSVLGYDHDRSEPALRLWNDGRHVADG